MIRRDLTALALALLAGLALAGAPAAAAEVKCPDGSKVQFKAECFGLESVSASLTSTDPEVAPNQAGAHPDFSFAFKLKEDPDSEPDASGLRPPFAPLRNTRIEIPPGLVGDPNVLGLSQQCRAAELILGECPNGSQIGIAKTELFNFGRAVVAEPIYMMVPPEGSDVVARTGFSGGVIGSAIYANLAVRSESDFGLSAEVIAPDLRQSGQDLVSAEATLWGVPAAPVHDRERCTPKEVFFDDCTLLPAPGRPPGTSEKPLLTNPTRCEGPLELTVNASSWAEPELKPGGEMKASLPPMIGCEKLSFSPRLSVQPTSHRAASPTGLEMTMQLPRAEGVEVLEPSQIRDVRIALPQGMAANPASSDGLGTCSEAQVHYKKNVAAQCPQDSKLAATEFEVGGLPRRMKGAIYLREPEPGNLFRVWVVADDLGAHIKLPAQLEVDKATGQMTSVLLEAPQAPLREVKLAVKSGFRAPLMTPPTCGTYSSAYDLRPWSGEPDAENTTTPMKIDEGCDTGGFDPKLNAGPIQSAAGHHSPFTFTLTREDGEQNPASLDVTLPRGMSATFAGIAHCEGAAAESGQCPAESRIGRVTGAVGVGPAPLWVPQPGKRPTAVYLGAPYKGAPLSVIAVVPAQAGPFDLGDQVVRSAVYVNPDTAEASARSDALPQMLEGVPILYRTVNVLLDRPGFSLNPTSCARKLTTSAIHSSAGATAAPSAPFAATGCGRLAFKPKLGLRLFGGTHRGAHPRLRAVLRMPRGGANIARSSVALPHSEFLDQAHIKTVCTRVQFNEGGGNGERCPAGSIYGHVKAITPLLDEPIEGNMYLRSSSHTLPDMVFALHGPPSLPIAINVVGRIDSVNGGIRTTFEGVPDAPVTELIASFPGGKKGLIVNSTDLCKGTHRVTAKFNAQNGKRATLHPVLKSKCKKRKRR